MKKIKTELENLALACAILVIAMTGKVEAQSLTLIPLPTSTLTGAANWGTTATTNLVSGWANITSYTNITTLWNTSSNAFINTTNITSTTNTLYADFDATTQAYVTLQHQFNQTSGDTSNSVLVVSRSNNGLFFDTINNISVTNTPTVAGTAAAPTVGVYQLDMRGFTRGRIVSWTYQSTGVSDIVTNQGLYVTPPIVKQQIR